MLHYQLSHWEQETFFQDIDIAIIGSGIVGLSAAISLREQAPRKKVVVLERGPLPIGASSRNAGFACFGSLSELLDDLEHSNMDEVLQLVEQRFRGLQRLRQRYSDQAIGYEALGGYEVFRQSDQERFSHCQEQLDRINQELTPVVGEETYAVEDRALQSFGMAKEVEHLILNQAEGQLHTGKLMQTLLQRAQDLGVKCFCGLAVNELLEVNDKVELDTNYGWSVTARRVLVATNGFAHQLLPDLTVQPARNQVLVTTPIPALKLKGCFHYDRGYVYFRNVGQRVLLGGGRHLNPEGEQTAAFGHTEQIQDYLTQLLREVILPNQPFEIERWWSGIMGVGDNKRPIIKSISPYTTVAVRLGGMGVALGTEAGEQAAQLLLEE
ncbi:MAG: FAD-dependent oxidoreductase [Bacteroidota bacterium]